jgi:hypothetical protein
MTRLVRRSGKVTIAGAVLLVGVAGAVALTQTWCTADRPGGRRAVMLGVAATLPGFLLGWVAARQPFSSAATGAANALAAMLVRLAVPLVAIGWLSRQPRDVAAVAPADHVLGAYLALLAADIGLHVVLRREAAPAPPVPRVTRGEGVAD